MIIYTLYKNIHIGVIIHFVLHSSSEILFAHLSNLQALPVNISATTNYVIIHFVLHSSNEIVLAHLSNLGALLVSISAPSNSPINNVATHVRAFPIAHCELPHSYDLGDFNMQFHNTHMPMSSMTKGDKCASFHITIANYTLLLME